MKLWVRRRNTLNVSIIIEVRCNSKPVPLRARTTFDCFARSLRCHASANDLSPCMTFFVLGLLLCTEHENSNLANLAESLFERCRMSNWVIVSKALVTFHNLMSVGNEVCILVLVILTIFPPCSLVPDP